MAIARNNKDKRPQANKLFTDREEPRKVFWDAYTLFKSNITAGDDNELKAISYYGIGGIGKSSLLKQLKTEMVERVEKPLTITIDFEDNQDVIAILTKMRNLLRNNHRFEFPIFDLAYLAYMQKQGHQVKKEEIESFISSSPLLNAVLDISSVIPVAGTIIGMLKGIDNLNAAIRNSLDSRKRELNEIKNDEPDVILKNMPYYISCDIESNLEKQTEPLVIFIDTYEALVNELASIGAPLEKDVWLRHEERGLIVNIPNAIWVIAGRDKLKWERFNPEWAGTLDQHLLGNLSEIDTESFLYNAGISDRPLIPQIYQLTGGVPLFLDICVDRYHAIVEKGKTPSIEDLGTNTYELISRFIKYMDDHKKSIVYLLSCLEDWTEELLQQLVQAFLPSIPFATLSAIQNYSFIITEDNQTFKMHQSIRKIVYSDCDENIAGKINRYMKAHYHKALEALDMPIYEYGNVFKKAVIYDLRCGFESEAAFIEYYKVIYTPLNEKLLSRYQFGEAIFIGEQLLNYSEDQFGDCLATTYCELSLALAQYLAGNFKIALDLSLSAYEKFTQYFSETHPDTVKAMQVVILAYRRSGKYEESLKLSEKLYSLRVATNGEQHAATIDAQINLAIAYRKTGDFQKAVEMAEAVLDHKQKALGEEHPTTIMAMSSLANAYRQSGEYVRACQLSEKVVALRTAIDGEQHPYTLAAMGSLSHSYRLLEKHDLATALAEKVVAGRKESLYEDHPLTIRGMNNLANAYRKIGKSKEAFGYAEKVYQIRREALGENHPSTIGALSNLATSYRHLEQYEEGFKHAAFIYEWRLKKFGEIHPATLRAQNNLANAYEQLNQKDQATAIRKALIEKAEKHYHSTHPAIVTAHYNLTHDILLDVDEEDSEDLAEESFELLSVG